MNSSIAEINNTDSAGKLIIGIDGGGTKSHLGLFDLRGKCVGISVRGPLNHENMEGSFEELEKVLAGYIMEALDNAGANVGDIHYGVFGLAGVDTRRQHKIISGMLREIGLNQFTLCNDAYLGVAAGCPEGIGICAINGTGSTMAAVDHSGVHLQIGGVGHISNDCGGSAWYGRQVLGAIYGELFKSEQTTLLSRMVFDKLGISDKKDYIESITNWIEDDEVIVNYLNPLAFEAAGMGDTVATNILKKSAKHYAGGITHLVNELDFPEDKAIYVTLAGSVFVKEKIRILPDLIEDLVQNRLGNRDLRFLRLDTVPVAGAVFWAFQNIGIRINMESIVAALTEHFK